MMAEARTPRVDKLDPEKINGQWRDWRDRMVNFVTSDKSEKESLLKELEENIPERLIEFEDCIKLFLENRFDLEDLYWIPLWAENLLCSIENMSTKKQIESGQLYRLDRLKEKLTGANIHGYWDCTFVLNYLECFSDGLKSIESKKDRSDEELLDMLNELEIHSYYSVDKMKKVIERCKEERWLGTLLLLCKRMMKEAQLLNTRMSDTLPALKSKPSSFKHLTEMKSSLENALGSSGVSMKSSLENALKSSGTLMKSSLENALGSSGVSESDSKVVLDPGTDYSHVCTENQDVVVTFSSGTVQSSQEIFVTLEPVSIEKCKFPLTEVAGYSDVIYIRHDQGFLKPVTVTMPVVLTGDCHISSCDLFCVHIDDDGLTIDEEVKIEVLDEKLCRFSTSTFPGNAVYAERKVKGNQNRNLTTLLKQLRQLHGASPHNILVYHRNAVYAERKVKGNQNRNLTTLLKQLRQLHGASPHNILVFIGAGSTPNTWRLHAEVVDQNDMDDIINSREQERSVFEFPQCMSPSFIIRGIKQIEVVLGSNGSIGMYNGSSQQCPVINIVPGGQHNFVLFPITRKNKENMAIVHFKAVGRKSLLHSTYFDPMELDRFPYQAKVHQVASASTPLTKKTEAWTLGPSFSDNKQVFTNVTPNSSISSTESLGSQFCQKSEFFGDKSMLSLTKQISGDDMYQVAVLLGIPLSTFLDIKSRYPNEFKLTTMEYWLGRQTCSGEEMVSTLCRALKNADLDRIAKVVDSVYKENRALEKADFQN